MILSDKTARQMFAELRADTSRSRYRMGKRPALINVDLQCAYTRPEEFVTAYEGDLNQFEHVNTLAAAVRRLGGPVIWSYVEFWESGEDCGVFGSKDDNADSQQNVKHGSRRAALDERLEIAPTDILFPKRMPSVFHETNLQSLLTWRGCDSVIVTGGSTSGCVRATVVDAMARGYFVCVPMECVADRHESPHFGNLYDMEMKYALVEDIGAVLAHLAMLEPV
ncbi:MAG: isochorismatase family protein [Acidocella sp.]|nr:isochorismatase family protein [Acidocella sp.]